MAITQFSAVIADAATESGAIDLGPFSPLGLFVPTGFEGTSITFKAAPQVVSGTTVSAGTYVPVYDGDGALLSYTVAAGQFVPIDPTHFTGIRFLKIVAGTAQTGASTVTVPAKQIF